MIERQLFLILTEGIAGLVAKPKEVEQLFLSRGIDPKEVAGARAAFEAFAKLEHPVIHSYPLADSLMPVWSIVLGGETEEQNFLHDETSVMDDAGHDEGILSSVWRANYQILIYAEHSPDVAVYLYTIAKHIVSSRRHELLRRANAMQVGPFSGADLAPDKVYMPAFLFVRGFNVPVLYEDQHGNDDTEQPLSAQRYEGIHRQDGGPTQGGIYRRVRTY